MFIARIMSTFTALFTLFSVDTVASEGSEAPSHLIEIAIVVTNLFLIVATLWLVRATTRDAMSKAEKALEGEQETNRLLIRVIRGMSRRQTGAKHRKGAATKEGSDQ